MKKIYTFITVVIVTALLLPASSALGWGATGHQVITAGAVLHLPEPLKSFFSHYTITFQTKSQIEPSPSYSHYIDIDWYPEFALHTFPHDENVLIAKYGLSTVQNNGDGPWAIANTESQLSSLMRSAKTTQDWINLLSTAGTLAHFTEDLHQPMHLTTNYWVNGLHTRYETNMISPHSAALAPVANPAACRYLTPVIDSVFSQIDVDYPYNTNLVNADAIARGIDPSYSTAYLNSLWGNTSSFTIMLFQAASEQLASELYTAWVDAGSPNPPCYFTLEGDVNGDCRVDFLDLSTMALQWLNTCGAANEWCSETDIDHSTSVDFADFAVIASNWLIDCYDTPTSMACTPN